jgi:pimeloyl-ACP methyl ester carboxylesterase
LKGLHNITLWKIKGESGLMVRQIIFIPGIMGTVLTEKFGAKIWPRKLPVDLVKYNLYENKLSMGKNVVIEPLEPVKQMYGYLEKQLSTNETKFTPFPYDWRLNNLDQLELLEDYIDTNADEVIIVAHSMGGLIAKLFLNKNKNKDLTKNVTKLITLGTPWLGAMDAYRTIKYGKSLYYGIILSERESKKISPTFPSVYQLLPNEQYFNQIQNYEGIPLLIDENKEYNDWDTFFEEKVFPHFGKHHTNYRKIFNDFRNLLQEQLDVEHHEFIGFGVETIVALSENEAEEVDAHFRNGDGTVPLFSAISHAEKRYFIKDTEHGDLAKSDIVLDSIKNIIAGNSIPRNEFLYTDLEEVLGLGFEAYIVRIACPVMISLIDSEGNPIYGYSDSLDDRNIEIPNPNEFDIFTIGSTTYVIVKNFKEIESQLNPNELGNRIVVEAYNEGPTSISISKYSAGKLVEIQPFTTFEIDPSRTAELSFSPNIINNTLTIKEQGKVESVQKVEPIKVKSNLEELILPKTNIEIYTTDDYLQTGDIHVVNDDIDLDISHIQGSYQVDSTYCISNGELILLNSGKLTSIPLKLGLNELKIFSRDILGNAEVTQVLNIFKIPEQVFDIRLEFFPEYYILDIKENHYLSELLAMTPQIPRPLFSFELDNDKGLGGNLIQYSDDIYQRKVTVRYTDLFEHPFSKEFYVYEAAITSIFGGVSKKETFEEFLNGFSTSPPKKIRLIKKEGKGVYKTIREYNIANSNYFYISWDHLSIEISRGHDYKVSFQNLMEDINLEKETDYNFDFKVISLLNRKEFRTLKLKYSISFDIGKEDFETGEYNIDYDYKNNVYGGTVDMKIIKSVANQYWDDSKLNNIDLLIKERANGNVLRSQRITVR